LSGLGSGSPGNDIVTDFVQGEDVIDLTAFHTGFPALVAGRANVRNENPIEMRTEGHDTILDFADGGSVRILGVTQLQHSDFLL